MANLKRRPSENARSAGASRHYECHLDYDCNRRCRFCSLERLDQAAPGARPSLEALRLGLCAARTAGCVSASFLGGEPTLRPGLAKLVKAAKELGYGKITLFSNGLRFSSLAYARRLAGAGLDLVNLNIPSHEEKVFDCLTGQPGGFQLLLSAVSNLRRLGLPMHAVCVLNRLNYKKLAGYAAFYADLGINVFTLNQLKFQGRLNPFVNAANPDISRLKVKMTACAPYVKAMEDYCLERGLCPPFTEHFVPCALKARRCPPAGRAEGGGAPARRAFFSTHPDRSGALALNLGGRDRVHFAFCARCRCRESCPGVEKNYLKVFGPSEFKPLK